MVASRMFLNAARPAARRNLPRPQAYRNYATVQSTAPQQSANASHVASGVAGGAVVLGLAYGYYHYSGAAKAVSTARSLADGAANAKSKILENTPSGKEAIKLAKSVAKTYAAAIPGGSYAVDQGFDQLEAFVETHGEKAQELVTSTWNDIQKAAAGGKDSGDQILKALQTAAGKMQELVGEEASKGWSLLGEKYPELQKALGGESEELKKLTEKHGPEARQIATDFYSQASALVAKGGFNSETYESVKKLLEQKKDEVAKFSQKAGKDAWESSSKAASPFLEKMPDVKQLVDENLEKVSGYVGEDRVKIVKEVYSELADIGKSNKSVEEKTKLAKKLVEEKLGTTSQFASIASDRAQDLAGSAHKWLEGTVPGLGGLTKAFTDVDLKALKELASKRGEDGEKLLSSTVEEIKQILAKKSEEAKKLGEKTASEAKNAKN
ncbi:uncharacterized protein JCM15063_001225 [Sporobolomyces koalae]|uniref:uncharacterized protein n=1 Tax=Sporobolomyces koalae TaxID=500713 RepID=UPI00316F0E07